MGLVVREDGTGAEGLDVLYAELAAAARARLGADPHAETATVVQRRIDARFRHQAHDLGVPLDPGPIGPASLARAADRYRVLYRERYGTAPNEPVEFVGHRVVATRSAPGLPAGATRAEASIEAPRGTRRAWFAETGEVEVPVTSRAGLTAGVALEGPALVQEPSSTTVVPPGWRARVDAHGLLLLTPR